MRVYKMFIAFIMEMGVLEAASESTVIYCQRKFLWPKWKAALTYGRRVNSPKVAGYYVNSSIQK